jgi:hypothetical protein
MRLMEVPDLGAALAGCSPAERGRTPVRVTPPGVATGRDTGRVARRLGRHTVTTSGAPVPPAVDSEVALRELLGRIAPGTALRDGLERILAGRTGALIVLGYDRVVESICTGGFALDVALSATRLRELAKMDGAVIVSYDGTRIVRAGVHLMPTRPCRPRSPAPGTAPPSGSPSRPASR